VALDANELDLLIELTDQMRTLAVQTEKLFVELEAMRRLVFPPQSASEDALRALASALDESTANEMHPDRPSVAEIDNVLRRLLRLRRSAH
jgi:hypothetical protein